MPVNRSFLLLAALLLAAGGHAQTASEQAELDANANPTQDSPPVPTGDGGALDCPDGLEPVQVYSNDFEGGDGGWTGGGPGDWEHGAVVSPGTDEDCGADDYPEPAGAASGSNAWATNLDGCYANSGGTNTLQQSFDLSGLSAPVRVTWNNWYHVFYEFDTAEVRANGDLVFEVTTSDATGSYQPEEADLSAYAGMSDVTLSYEMAASTVVNRYGWYVDDIVVEGCGQGGGGAETPAIPTLNTWGLVLLGIALLGVAGVAARRQAG